MSLISNSPPHEFLKCCRRGLFSFSRHEKSVDKALMLWLAETWDQTSSPVTLSEEYMISEKKMNGSDCKSESIHEQTQSTTSGVFDMVKSGQHDMGHSGSY